ncbi:Zinc finger Y-chromosomal protein [Clonorchis sinensis]|uniref:Zinc finger Y-chromosomal protein n=1 Tax=Clonorchis sinensis TaxID=79923 RepID=A0A8T1N0L9_CLOSI|nr:Zinc finger Y-chromosomal protein [Clonorchis sinensis]
MEQLNTLIQYYAPTVDSISLTLIRQRLPNPPSYANRPTVEPVSNWTRSKVVQMLKAKIMQSAGQKVSADISKLPCKMLPVRVSDMCLNESPRNRPRSQHVCTICGKKFEYHSDLKRHMMKHSATQSFLCDICGVKFKSQLGLMSHKQKSHFSSITPSLPHRIQCDICQKPFGYPSELERHMPMHSPTKKYECPKCDAKFRHKNSVRYHETMHHSEKSKQWKLACDICQRKFPNPSSLKRHYTAHTNKRAFSCILCDKTFTQAADLRIHQQCVHGSSK